MSITSPRCGPSLKIAAAYALVAIGLTGCASTNEKIGQNATPAAELTPQARSAAASFVTPDGKPVEGAELSYQLQPGDQVDVKFYFHPELNEQLLIGPDHRVALQLVGEINTYGLSPRALAAELTQRYAKTLRNPEATVILRKYAITRIFVAGEVNNPQAHAMDGGPLTALQAISQSGGFRRGAERANVIVLRNSGSGQPSFIRLDLQGHLEQAVQADLVLRPYDIVYVPQKRIAEVAEFFDEYLGKILPLYRNLGFSFTYSLRDRSTVVTPASSSTP
jgi:protein involved in polysaccharide export with SLBB domain